MSPVAYQLRRATVDDLPVLRALWESMGFSVAELEKNLTGFQVAVDPEGKVIGAIGFEMQQRHGRIHSEGYTDFSAAEIIRPLLWTRLQSLCSNHGVLRLWTQEISPFWTQNGLKSPHDEAERQKLPEAWRALPGNWLTIKLKDEEAILSLDKEFALYMEAEKARSTEALNQARKLKAIATVIAFIAALAGFGAAVYLLINRGVIRQSELLTPATKETAPASASTTVVVTPPLEQTASTNLVTPPAKAE